MAGGMTLVVMRQLDRVIFSTTRPPPRAEEKFLQPRQSPARIPCAGSLLFSWRTCRVWHLTTGGAVSVFDICTRKKLRKIRKLKNERLCETEGPGQKQQHKQQASRCAFLAEREAAKPPPVDTPSRAGEPRAFRRHRPDSKKGGRGSHGGPFHIFSDEALFQRSGFQAGREDSDARLPPSLTPRQGFLLRSRHSLQQCF